MANATINLPIDITNYLQHSSPYTVYKTNTSTEYLLDSHQENYLYGKVDPMPNNLKHNLLVGFTITLPIKTAYSTTFTSEIAVYALLRDYDPNTITYSGNITNDSSLGEVVSAGTTMTNVTSQYYDSPTRLSYIFHYYRAIKLFSRTYDHYTKKLLTNGSTKPYLTVTYDNAAKVKSAIYYTSSQLSGTSVNTATARTLEWNLVRDSSSPSGYCAVPSWTQTSARFYYRVSGASSWSSKSVSGATTSITIPAYTFKSGTAYEYYISATDEDGTTSNTSTYTFTTLASQLTVSSGPTSGSVSPANATAFSWYFKTSISGITVPSGTVSLYYKRSTAVNYTQVQASSGASTVTIPAYTFPTGSTIQWYLSGSDATGATSQTTVYSFTVPASQITATNSPTSGYMNPRNAISFGWYFNSLGVTVPSGSVSLYYKAGSASNYTQVQAASGATSVTIAANTFPTASTVQWYLSGSDYSGTTSQTTVYSFSTAAGSVTSDPISPKNTIESNNAPITFRWTYSSPDGFPPSRQILMWKRVTDDSWTNIVELTNGETSYTVPANTFPAGEIRWGAHPYNIDDVSGTGHTATFISYGAPAAPVVYATEVPFSEITWQADDQQAYEITVDDTVYGPYFGEEKTFKLPEYLEDGEHTVKVKIVGAYGLWSDYGQTEITIENTPGEDIDLTAEAYFDVKLIWETEETTTDILIYRDGVNIGRTNKPFFYDRLCTGRHEYYVVNRLPDGNYSKSATIKRKVFVDYLTISPVNESDWLQIVHTLKSYSDPAQTTTRTVSYTKLAGKTYPVVATSEFMERNTEYSAAFLFNEAEAHEKFRSMLGKPIIAKFRNGDCSVCFIDAWERTEKKHYYTAYTFTLHRIDWDDYIDDTE